MKRTAAHSQGRVSPIYRSGEEGGRVLMANLPETETWEILAALIETADALDGVPVFCIVHGIGVQLGPNTLPEELVREFLFARRSGGRVTLTDNLGTRDRVRVAWEAAHRSRR